MLTQPDAMMNDWYLWAAVLLAHGFIGLILTAAVAWIFKPAEELAGDMRRLAWVVVSAIYFLGWEGCVQTWGAGFLDAAVDTAAVSLGGLIGISAWARKGASVALSGDAMAGMLVVGIWRRK